MICTRRFVLLLSSALFIWTSRPLNGQSTNVFPSSGAVGIGTTSPGATLEIDTNANTSATNQVLIQELAGGASELVLKGGNGSTNRRAGLRFFSNQISPSWQWWLGSSVTQVAGDSSFYLNNAANSDVLTALQNGNVGVGTTTPYSTLHVYNGSSTVLGINPGLWLGKNSDGNYAQIGFGFSDSSSAYTPAAIAFKQNHTNGNDQSGDLLFAIGYNRTQSPPELMRLTASGMLGIGTSTPQYTLDVNGTARFSNSVIFNGTVNLTNVGTFSAPSGETLQISGTPSTGVTYPAVGNSITAVTGPAGSSQWSLALGPNVGYGYYSAIGFDAVHTNGGDQTGDLFIATSPFPTTGGTYTSPLERMRITAQGLVDIGTNEETCVTTTTAPCKLAVAGAIVAQEVVVNSTGADYVFDSGYHLAPLTEVAEYVQANHHLPGIPSARQVQEKGVSLGEMQSKLLAKIEELTLRMIQADEKIRQVEKQNLELSQKVRDLKEALRK